MYTCLGGVAETDSHTTEYIQHKSPPPKYKIPAEVNNHLLKCVKRPPPTPQPTKNKTEQTTPENNSRVSRQHRVRSAPTSRKLTRERSAERKLINGFTNKQSTNEKTVNSTEKISESEPTDISSSHYMDNPSLESADAKVSTTFSAASQHGDIDTIMVRLYYRQKSALILKS